MRAYRYITVAARLALSSVADAIATAPISKSILIDAGYNYPGHTELLGPQPDAGMSHDVDRQKTASCPGNRDM